MGGKVGRIGGEGRGTSIVYKSNLEVVHDDSAGGLHISVHGFNYNVCVCRKLNCSWLTHTHT